MTFLVKTALLNGSLQNNISIKPSTMGKFAHR